MMKNVLITVERTICKKVYYKIKFLRISNKFKKKEANSLQISIEKFHYLEILLL